MLRRKCDRDIFAVRLLKRSSLLQRIFRKLKLKRDRKKLKSTRERRKVAD